MTAMTRSIVAALVAALALAVPAAAQEDGGRPLQTVASVDLGRYAGRWYEIARYPNRYQKDCASNVTALYLPTDDDKFEVLNECRDKDGDMESSQGRAKVVDTGTNAKFKVTFFWPFSGDYWIIDLGPNYEYAVIGEPKREHLWILSRTRQMDEALYAQILQRLAAQGYDTSKLVRTPQGA